MSFGILEEFATSIDNYIQSNESYDQNGGQPEENKYSERVKELKDLVKRPIFHLSDLPAYADALKNLGTIGLNDRELLLEKVLVLMSRLDTPDHKDISMKIQQAVIGLLYKDLPHPPSGYLTLPQEVRTAPTPRKVLPYTYRPADGSDYNALFTSLGKAGTPYARSVPSTTPLPPSNLPDPGLVYDTLLRREKFEPHPDGVSSLFFAFADLVIHSIFNTNHSDWNINDASSYLDLSILYGSSDADVKKVRRFDGTGRLHNDVFADIRLLMMPPSSCALLVLLCRNHNYIAEKLRDINEAGKFTSFPLDRELTSAENAGRLAQDEEIFQRARLINCGFFMQIILGDYVGAILGLARDGCGWRLDPLMAMRDSSHEVAPRGEGNVVSIEFNQLYRWHSTLSEQDEKWTNEMFSDIFETTDFNTVTIDDFKNGLHRHIIPLTNLDVKEWTFNKLKREPDGRFKDDDLANILHNATEWSAGAFKARGSPGVLRVIEIMGIAQSRTWGSCSLNEFRKFMGLRPYKTFAEWNPDNNINRAAAALYKDIDHLELYVGLQAEQPKDPGPGAGLCPGYTISRAILADAVCLTRGDRFLTVDFTPATLTSWGYQDCQFDKKDGSYGGLLTKLLFRTLPNHYPARSAYAHFPFLVPHGPRGMETKLNNRDPVIANEYIWTRPVVAKPPIKIDSFKGVKDIIADSRLVSAYDERLATITKAFSVSAEKFSNTKLTAEAKAKICRTEAPKLARGKAQVFKIIEARNKQWAEFLTKTTGELIQDKTVPTTKSQPHKYVDIIGDVINLLPVYFVASEITGIPLKTRKNSTGTWFEAKTVEDFAEIASYVYLNLDPADDWHLREDATETANKILEHIESELGFLDSTGSRIKDMIVRGSESHEFLKAFIPLKQDRGTRELAAEIFAAVVPTAALFSQMLSLVVNFYLQPNQAKAREEIVKLASGNENGKVMQYVYEALRLDPAVSAILRTATQDVEIDNVRVKAGEQVIANIVEANLDTRAFGSTPNVLNVGGPAGITNVGENGLVSNSFLEATFPGILRVIFSLKSLQTGPGRSGQLSRFTETWNGGPRQLFQGLRGGTTPWPVSLVIQYD